MSVYNSGNNRPCRKSFPDAFRVTMWKHFPKEFSTRIITIWFKKCARRVALLEAERVLIKRKDTYFTRWSASHVFYLSIEFDTARTPPGGDVVSGLRFQISIRRRSLQSVSGDGST